MLFMPVMPSNGRRGAFLLSLAVLPGVFCAPAAAQERVETMVRKVFQMTHQPAREALPLVDPLLSASGVVSWQQESNALVIRDRAGVLAKLEPLLADFDHPVREVEIELHLLEASRSDSSQQSTDETLPRELLEQLGSMLSLNRYEGLGSVTVRAREGTRVVTVLGSEYQLSFDAGTVLRHRFLKLSNFRVERRRASLSEQLFHSHVNLQLSRPAFVTVSRDAASASGLVIALHWKPASTGVSPAIPGVGAE